MEYGEYRGHLYGTSIESIKEVIASGKVCLLAPHTQVSFHATLPQSCVVVVVVAFPSRTQWGSPGVSSCTLTDAFHGMRGLTNVFHNP